MDNGALAKRLAKLEKKVRELEEVRRHCTCCMCRKYTKKIPIKKE